MNTPRTILKTLEYKKEIIMRPTLYLSKLIQLIIGLAEIVLVLRIVLRLFAANPTASFVHWIYTTSNTLLEPFRGIFQTGVIDKSYVLDFTALFALIVYGLLGSLLIYFVDFLERSIDSNTHSSKK
jgi:uncharacterized protein YggT (Ycf19 family)